MLISTCDGSYQHAHVTFTRYLPRASGKCFSFTQAMESQLCFRQTMRSWLETLGLDSYVLDFYHHG